MSNRRVRRAIFSPPRGQKTARRAAVLTITAPLTFESVGLLAAIVAIRTFLSFSLETEIEGCWPWQRAAKDAHENAGERSGMASDRRDTRKHRGRRRSVARCWPPLLPRHCPGRPHPITMAGERRGIP